MIRKICFCIILSSLVSAPAWAQSGAVKLLQAGESEVVLELAAPPFDIVEVDEAGVLFQQISIPGLGKTSVPGHPQVPVGGSLVGVSDIRGVKIEVLETKSKVHPGYDVYPSPKLVIKEEDGVKYPVEEFYRDDTAYSKNIFYPGQIVKLDETGYMRDQAVVRVLFYPVQFNPATRKIRFYTHIKVKVSWPPAASTKLQIKQLNGAYENQLKKAFINYKSLPSPVVQESLSLAVSTQQFEPSPDPGYKISIKEDGLYRITRTDLEAAGGNLSGVDPATIKVLHLGQEIPIHVNGTGDSIFDPTDYVEFYAQAINTEYTNTNIYWVTYGGANGLRLSDVDGGLSGSPPVPTEYRALLHLEEDHTYWGEIPNGADKDPWFWGRIYTPPTSSYDDYYTASFNLDQVIFTGDCQITINLQGRTNTSTDPDHHTRIYLNDTQIDDQWWDGQTEFTHQLSVSQSYLVNGTNTLKVYSVGDTGSILDQIYLNWIEIGYDHLYAAENNVLTFDGQVGDRYQYEITDFTSNDIELYDITDPDNIVRIVNSTVEPDGPGYKLIFQQDEGSSKYFALTSNQRKSPQNIVLDNPSDLSNPTNGADYIIITYDDFYNSLQPLADFRSQQGLRVITARLSDVYDEFNYGLREPQAIQNFLKYAYQNWDSPPPTYVLLVGDATMDYKDNYGFGKTNYMPTYFLEASGMNQAPSDNWYVCVSGDDFLPDMFLGRISVQTSADAGAVVNKIINYEQNPAAGNWNQNMLLAADDEPTFEQISNHLTSLIPSPYTANKVNLSNYGSTGSAKTALKNYINNGSLITAYTGHGNKTIWAGEGLFELTDIASLTNNDRLTMVVSFTCLDGYFSHPIENYCMAEEFVRANNKGALAVFSNTGYGYPSEQIWLGNMLYRTVFEDKNRILGVAGTSAKIEAYSQYGISGDYIKTYTLFGDPASVLKVVNQPPVLSVPGVQQVDEGSLLSFSVSAEDTDLNETVTLSDSGVPSGANFDTDTGSFSWTPGLGQAGQYNITFIATDSWGDSDTEVVPITVDNTNPPCDPATCDDNNACNGVESCDPQSGCVAGPAPDCNDGNPCTDDSCDDQNGCQYVSNTDPCNDGFFCTVNDTCSSGTCSGQANSCSDNVDCTDDSCNEANDVCVNTANNANCDDGLWCDGAETCDANLDCQAGTPPDCSDTNPGNPCDTGSCNETTDSCRQVAANAGSLCRASAGGCDVAETCDGINNDCPADAFEPPGTACGDQSDTVCNNPDSCNGGGVCLFRYEPGTTECRADAGVCDVAELCDGAGSCPADGYQPDGTGCDDGLLCTENDICSAGTCGGQPIDGCNARLYNTCDINGDGKDDLILYVDGTGLFWRDSANDTWHKILDGGYLLLSLASADLNGDGKDDIIVDIDGIGLYWWDSVIGAWDGIINSSFTYIVSADINGDGKDDIIVYINGTGLYWRDSASNAWNKILGACRT